jgi:predicted MFS family arabinose efflux permease
LLAERVDPARQGTAFGLLTSAPQVAAVVGGLALPLVAEPFGWRITFVAPALIGVAALAALLPHGIPAAPRHVDAPRMDRRRLPRAVSAIAASAALASAAGIGMRSFLVVSAASAGFEPSVAGLMLALTGVVAIANRLGFGVLSDRRPHRSLHQAAALMALCAVGLVLMAGGGDLPILAGAMLAGGIGWGWQAPLSHAVVTGNPGATAAAVGMQLSGFFAGAVVGPLMVGLFAGGGDYTAAWLICACLALLGAALALLAHRLAPGRPGHQGFV